MCKNDEDKPIIKLFVYRNCYYVYDTYTNRLFEISEREFIELKNVQKYGFKHYEAINTDDETHQNILMLIQKGMLKKSFIEIVLHSETKYTASLLNRCITDLTLQVTKNCNFNCRYCSFSNNNKIARGHEKQDMSWEIAKRSIDYLYTHSSDMNEVTISFYGGEPLLNFQLIKQTVEYAESIFQSKKIEYVMTTNASIFTNEIIDFIAKYKFLLTISFDGPPSIQNFHRKYLKNGLGTFNDVFHNVKMLKKMHPEYFQNNVLINPVLFEDEDKEMIQAFFCHEFELPKDRITVRDATLNGIDYIAASTNETYKRTTLYKLHDKLAEDINDGLIKIYNDKSYVSPQWHHNGPCVPGVRMLFVDVNGAFYPCEKCPEEDCFRIGSIETGLNIEKATKLMNIGELSEMSCKTCWAIRFCNMCAIRCYDCEKKELTAERKAIACREEREKTLKFLTQQIDSRKGYI